MKLLFSSIKKILLVVIIVIPITKAETIEVDGNLVDYQVRSSKHNAAYDKLSVEIEVSLVNKQLPSKIQLKAVSDKVMKSQPSAKKQWVAILLPKMKSGAGAYATDHRTPNPEGMKLMPYMLVGTVYEHLVVDNDTK